MNKNNNIEDTNLADYDSPAAKAARKQAAQSQECFQSIPSMFQETKNGLVIWRVENKRTENDVPDFGLAKWPENQYGQFYSGDSYLVLHAYSNGGPKILYDIHFLLGNESTQDEVGVAAYKAVELDDLLDGQAVQHRETQQNESALFKSYFAKQGIMYMQGGHASGFRPAGKNEYKTRLFQIATDLKKNAVAFEVEPLVSSLNEGDVFILDVGETIFLFHGKSSSTFELFKARTMANNLKLGRPGKAPPIIDATDSTEEFWKALGGGSRKDVKLMQSDSPNQQMVINPVADKNNCILFRLTDEDGTLKFLKVHQGRVYPSMLRAKDVFILDAIVEIFCWIGLEASGNERQNAMSRALSYLKSLGRPNTLPITIVKQGETNKAFDELVFAGKKPKGWIARAIGAPEQDPALQSFESVLEGIALVFESCVGAGRENEERREREWNIVDRSSVETSSKQPLPVRL